MSIDEIKSLSDKFGRTVLDCAADNAHLYLWTINKYLERSYEIVRAWGFEPSTMLIWCKDLMGIGLGGDYKLTTEFCLYARRGSLLTFSQVNTTWFNWSRGRHSKKPEEFYKMVEDVSPGPYVDLFAREARSGWICWGNEINDT